MADDASDPVNRMTGRPLEDLPEDSQADAAIPSRASSTSAQSFTPRSLAVGLVIGALITFSNTYFGLQTGWISTMAMPSALIGFSVFKVLTKYLSFPFTPIENVLIQTVAGAVGTMPLGCGFVGVIPALEFLLKTARMGLIWSLGVCLFGVVFAVPLRKEVIVREKLRFPSGTASALMLRVLHGAGKDEKTRIEDQHSQQSLGIGNPNAAEPEESRALVLKDNEAEEQAIHNQDWRSKMRLLIGAFVVSGVYVSYPLAFILAFFPLLLRNTQQTIFSYFVPLVHDIPLLGLYMANNWLWTLNPLPAYIGQGIIMGPETCMHMLFGAVLGWGILSPLAKSRGWAPGPVDSWEDGSKAWIVWVSLAIMLADSLVSLGWLVIKPLVFRTPQFLAFLRSTQFGQWIELRLRSRSSGHSYINYSALDSSRPSTGNEEYGTRVADDDEDAPPSQLISTRTVVILLPLTLILNVILLLSIMGVRALGETDLNPVSGISKLTQLLFSLATPASRFSRRTALVTNLLAGAVSESGALQAGDMMQDLKTGHLLGASPKAQFYGQMIGSLVGAFLSTAIYKTYVSVYDIPGDMFQTPTAYVWIFTARLVTGEGLPPMAWQASVLAGLIWMILTGFRIAAASPSYAQGGKAPAWRAWIPGGIAVAVGIFNVPSFTLARAIGGLIAWWWARKHADSNRPASGGGDANSASGHIDQASSTSPGPAAEKADAASSTVVVLASGLILGEGILSIVNLLLASGKVPHL
ncbi:hypothetical protein N7470_009553 [Penicillium chermesinum]|nr:hypothetical protein N7470_009553 [Penicillium chermesinum]